MVCCFGRTLVTSTARTVPACIMGGTITVPYNRGSEYRYGRLQELRASRPPSTAECQPTGQIARQSSTPKVLIVSRLRRFALQCVSPCHVHVQQTVNVYCKKMSTVEQADSTSHVLNLQNPSHECTCIQSDALASLLQGQGHKVYCQ